MADQGRVLLAEDDDVQRLLLREVLEEAGYEVHDAASPGGVLALLARAPPDVVLMDLVGMADEALVRAVRAAAGGPALCLVSAARTLPEVARDWRAEGFLPKPFALDGLLAQVAGLMAARRARG